MEELDNKERHTLYLEDTELWAKLIIQAKSENKFLHAFIEERLKQSLVRDNLARTHSHGQMREFVRKRIQVTGQISEPALWSLLDNEFGLSHRTFTEIIKELTKDKSFVLHDSGMLERVK